MTTHFISKANFQQLIAGQAKTYKTFYLAGSDTQFYWKKSQRNILFWKEYKGNLDGFVSAFVRAQDPLKQFVFSSKEKVAQDYRSLEDKSRKPFLLIGAKNCDLAGLDTSDFVFMEGDYQDPFYVSRRESMFIIASDCSNPIDVCFCVALGNNPYPEKNYDIGISDVGGGFVVEAVTQRAQQVVSNFQNLFETAQEHHLQKRKQLRHETVELVERNIAKHSIPRKEQLKGIMDTGFESNVWQDEVKTCVECGCCNVVCPTCHCFVLGDKQEKDKAVRFKIWDACLLKDFAVVAGGANPRKQLFQRLRNRYDKKFGYFPAVADFIACTGCGRCILGCPAKIDIRRILRNLVVERKAKA